MLVATALTWRGESSRCLHNSAKSFSFIVSLWISEINSGIFKFLPNESLSLEIYS